MNCKDSGKYLFLAAILASPSSTVALGEAHKTWLKLNYTAKSLVQVNIPTGNIAKLPVSKGSCYAQLCYTPVAGDVAAHYQVNNYCEDLANKWILQSTEFSWLPVNLTESASGNFAYETDVGLIFSSYKPKSDKTPIFFSVGNVIVKITKGANGAFRKATWGTVSSSVVVGGWRDVYGDQTDTDLMDTINTVGSSVAESKLPFVPTPCP
jgi:hypothetical protein